MENRENSSHNNWLAVLRRKIQKKFKRNRHKLESSASLDDFIDEEPEPAPPTEENANNSTADQLGHLSAQDYEVMKKELFKLPWYWPKLSRIDSQKLLSNQLNGSFLIRDSSEQDSFTLSFRTNSKTFHCRNQWSQILATEGSERGYSLMDIIESKIKNSQTSVVGFVKCDNNEASFPTSYAVRLIHPICRNVSVPTLQNLCLSQIKSKVNKSNINSLPLPKSIKEYVRENYNTL